MALPFTLNDKGRDKLFMAVARCGIDVDWDDNIGETLAEAIQNLADRVEKLEKKE